VHGFPRTSLMWRFLAPKLAENHTVICVDLRVYGRSGIPESTEDHFPYSKRAMANELVEVMSQLGFWCKLSISRQFQAKVFVL
jgi:haloacetate dehalogenase